MSPALIIAVNREAGSQVDKLQFHFEVMCYIAAQGLPATW